MRNVFILFLLLSLGFTQTAKSSGDGDKNTGKATLTLSGQVTDASTGEPLAGVRLHIAGSDKTVYTNFHGEYKLKELTRGTHDIVVSYISYKDACQKNVHLNAKKKAINFQLAPLD